ncbi:hypothetical protein [Streptomyces sp. NPDC006134]|uniref:hypothetical protein n=1 Tax=Streptomyces sp. NPDC006134 TaxID=3154467 RepID=UPI0033E1BCAA
MSPACAALALFAATRLGGAVVLAVASRAAGKEPLTLLGRTWDSRWYLGIAADGYGRTLRFGDDVVQSDLAFFPLYPALVRAVGTVLPVDGMTAGLLVSWLAAAVAACGLYALGARLHGRAVGTALVVVWGLLPHSVVLSMAYTEPVLTACAAWSLHAVLTGRWVWAGALACLAGLARPNGIAVAAAVVTAAAVELWRGRRRPARAARRLHRLWTGAALAPLGWTAYLLWVGHRTGDPLGGYFAVQRGWGSRFDFGQDAVGSVRHLVLRGDRLDVAMSLLAVAAAALLYVLLLLDRAPLPLLVHSGVLLLIALGGAGFFASKPRFLLPAFPLLLPLAQALVRTARARPWHATAVVGALAGLSYAYGAYLLILTDTPL